MNLNEVEKAIGYNFKDKNLIYRAFTHSSVSSENNEKLEFFGDSVLGFIVADYLYKFGEDEGQMTKKKADIVCEVSLAETIDNLGVVDNLYAGPHLKANLTPAIKCDLCEAIIGAMYIDGGLQPCKDFVMKFVNLTKHIHDSKSELQELIQKEGVNYIHYNTTKVGGESHNPIFESRLYLHDKLVCSATGGSKREAEQKSAEKALKILKGEEGQ